jgi:inorganic triphosphatase YgiF
VAEGAAEQPGFTEREWQFEGDAARVRRWLADAGDHLVGAASEEEIVDTYFETPNWGLTRSGFTCRVRASCGRIVATLKSFGRREGDALVRRELEQPLPKPLPPWEWPPGPARSALAASVPLHALRPIFVLRTRRLSYRLIGGGTPVAILSLDRCAVEAPDGGLRGSFERVELEALPGAEEAAAELARLVAEECGLWPASGSKFVTAVQLVGLEPPALG